MQTCFFTCVELQEQHLNVDNCQQLLLMFCFFAAGASSAITPQFKLAFLVVCAKGASF